jgi:hypothetical protein
MLRSQRGAFRGKLNMQSGTRSRNPIGRGAVLALLLFGLALLPASGAVALQIETISLVAAGDQGACNVNNTMSCVFIEQSSSWEIGRDLTIAFDNDNKVGDLVPFEITDLATDFPSISGFGVDDQFFITTAATGNFNLVTGAMSLSFGLKISRQGFGVGVFSPEVTYSMTTGTAMSGPCGIGNVNLDNDGLPYDDMTGALALVGAVCMDVAPVGATTPNEKIVQISIVGTLSNPPTGEMMPVPEPTLALGGIALLGLALARRRRA